jgi:hypothetical protein
LIGINGKKKDIKTKGGPMIALWLESIQKHWNDNEALGMIKMKIEHYTGRKVHFFGKRKSAFFIVWEEK